jgi:hypothetical protein
MVKALNFGLMAQPIKEVMWLERKKAAELSCGVVALFTKAILRIITLKGRESIYGKINANILEDG